MLVRSAGRRQQRRNARLLSACFAQLSLPWLAPAQLRWSATHTSMPSQAVVRPRRRGSSPSRPAPAHTRQLATATDQYTIRYGGQYPPPGSSNTFRNRSQDSNLPWDITQSSKARLSSLQPYAAPILITPILQAPDQSIKVLHGVQGTAHDLLQHLHTALQVGRFNRAEVIIQRLNGLFSRESAELLYAHTAYLEAQLRALSLHGRGEQGERVLVDMQKWFEVEVKKSGVTLDARILIVMIRASIKALTGSRRDRTIKRYLELAQNHGEEVLDEVLESEQYDDNEFTLLGRINYELNLPLEEVVEEPAAAIEEPHPPFRRLEPVPMEDVPEVRSMDVRGEGLRSVKSSLLEFAQTSLLPSTASAEEQLEQARKRQKIMEDRSVDVAIDRWRKADEELRKIGIHTSMQSKPMNALMWQWFQALVPALKEELAACQKLLNSPGRTDHDRYHYGPYLELLPLDKIAASTILHTLTRLAAKERDTDQWSLEIKLTTLTSSLAKTIEKESILGRRRRKSMSKQDLKLRSQRRKGILHGRLSKEEAKKQFQMSEFSWPTEARIKFGAMLASKLIETAQLPVTRMHPRTGQKITQMQPAFLHRLKFDKGKRIGMISPNPALTEKLESEPVGSLLAKYMPMVVEPRPWSGWNRGGYLYYPNAILRLPSGDRGAQEYFSIAHGKGDMTQIYAGLTALGEVPWNINHDVFKVQLEAWNSGEAIANLAPLHPKFDIPPEPAPSADPAPRRQWLSEVREIEYKRTGLHSQRCFQNFQMEIARTMLNETLYFPHNMDFRGRAYPIPPYLNHMGADNVRGLLVFAKGKKLGTTGLRWLKIHLATVAGHDKASISERIEFTTKHIDDIYDSARNPLGGRRWWLQAEDAWQTLAACYELTAALDSPDPENFISHLPIQQDGTCNGLQHYAALGGDQIGAAQVNLEPGDRPADVYTAVAEAVKEEVHQDALQGHPVAQKLDGRLTRKCVKQPVMTNVYGVTWFGAKEQVRRQLEVLFPEVRKFDEVNLGNMSQFIATKIFKSLGTMFGGAQAIQHWLGQCADRISTSVTPEQFQQLVDPTSKDKAAKKKAGRPKKPPPEKDWLPDEEKVMKSVAKPHFKSTVVWTTPLRLPVVQPYRSASPRQIKTNLQSVYLQEPQSWDPVSKRKQLQAFPPNFIHSLDASHMLLSALKCKEIGLTFASVHDSFWTHACDVDRLGGALRDSFIEMHSDNIIGRLREEFQTRYKGHMYLATVLAKSPVGERITALRHKRRYPRSKEPALEAERLRLLSSEDAEEREKGEGMTTPGSILVSEGDESAFAIPAEISSHQLGTIPGNGGDSMEATNSDSDDTGVPEITADAGEGIVGGGLLDTDAEATHAAVTGMSGDNNASKPKHGRSPKKYQRKLYVWMPLTFPDVPPKGEFDVRRIKESTYFFH